jgi:hypothetical protein
VEAIRTTRTAKAVELPLLDRVALVLLFLFLLTEVLNGAIRYYSAQLGLPWLPYVPHMLLFLTLFPMVFSYVVTEGVNSTYLGVVLLFSVGATVGVFNLGSASQVEFGFWVLAGLLYGIVALPAILRGWQKLIPYMFVLWVLAVVGVLINAFYTWPWIGFEYQVGATQIQASKLWQTYGVNIARLPGFSTGSYFAAAQILILALFLRQTQRRYVWLLAWFLSGVAIVLTTSKTDIGIYLFFSVLFLFSRGSIPRSWRKIPILAAGLGVFLPFIMLFVRLDFAWSTESPTMSLLVWSFTDRLQVTWPEYIRTIVLRGSALFGRGLGGIGTAQQRFEPALYMPADSVAVYLYGTFGVLGVIMLLVYGWRLAHQRVDTAAGRFFFLCGCTVLLAGVTTSALEGGLTGVVFGASLCYLQGRTVSASDGAMGHQRKVKETSLGESPA